MRVILFLLCASVGSANQHTVTFEVPGEVRVVREAVRLGDITEVKPFSQTGETDAAILRGLTLATGLFPGERRTVSADAVLAAIRSQQIDLGRVGYTMPVEFTVVRVGRSISDEELRGAVTEALQELTGGEIEVTKISPERPVMVDPRLGSLEIRAEQQRGRSGEITMRLRTSLLDEPTTELPLRVAFSSWGEVPVARRELTRGTPLSADDVQMARMDLNRLPADALRALPEVLGQTTRREVFFGEVLRSSALIPTQVVAAGSQVTILYRAGALEVTASGVALESGSEGSLVRVRNDASGRIVKGQASADGAVVISGEAR